MNQVAPSLDHQPNNLESFVDSLQAKGRYTFHKEEALQVLSVSEAALKLAANRLAKKQRLVSPRRGFFVIVPDRVAARDSRWQLWLNEDIDEDE